MLNGAKSTENKALEYSSVQKAIGILLSFVPDNKAMGNLELSKLLGLNKSTVSRLTHVLMYYGLIQQDEETKKYELGRTSALLGMAAEMSQNERLNQLAQPFIDYLRDAVEESVCLEVLSGNRVKVVCEAVGPPPLSVTFPESLPIHVAAGAKVMLAFSDKEVADSLLNVEFEKITDNTITSVDVFKEQLQEIRQQGVAYDYGEANADVHSVSAAVFNHHKRPVAAISICVPANRIHKITNLKHINLLKQTALSVSEKLYYMISDKT